MFFLIFLLFITNSITTPVYCTDDASVLSVLDLPIKDCHNVDTCRVNCKFVNGRNHIFHLQVHLSDVKLPDDIKNAFSETCAWYLERKEILTDKKLTKPQGRGQLISQFIIQLGRRFRYALPLPINPVKDTIRETKQGNTLSFSSWVKSPFLRNRPLKTIDNHRRYTIWKSLMNGQTIPTYHKIDGYWIPTVKTIRDWIDYLIYVSNSYTYFKDLCRKNHLKQAQLMMKRRLLKVAKKGLYFRYSQEKRPIIEVFVEWALDRIIFKFTEIYRDPKSACPCLDILQKVKKCNEYDQFKSIIKKYC